MTISTTLNCFHCLSIPEGPFTQTSVTLIFNFRSSIPNILLSYFPEKMLLQSNKKTDNNSPFHSTSINFMLLHSKNLLSHLCGFINGSHPFWEMFLQQWDCYFLKSREREWVCFGKGVTTQQIGVSILGMLLCGSTFGFVLSLYDDEVMNLTLNKCLPCTPLPLSIYEFSLNSEQFKNVRHGE